MGKPQVLTAESGEKMVVLMLDEYEDLVDSIAFLESKLALVEGRDELLTAEEVRASLAAPTLLAFWRGKRGLGASDVAAAAGIGESDLADYERGDRSPDKATLGKLCEALRVRPCYIGE